MTTDALHPDHDWHITVVPPPLGVRVRMREPAGMDVEFAASDDGGRGSPLWIVCLPVQQVGDRWCLLFKGKPQDRPTGEQVGATALASGAVATGVRPACYEASVPRPATAPGLLVLFVYSQCPDVGDDGAGRVVSDQFFRLKVATPRPQTSQLRSVADMPSGARQALARGFGPDSTLPPAPAAGKARSGVMPNPKQRSPLSNEIIERVLKKAFEAIAQLLQPDPTVALAPGVIELPHAAARGGPTRASELCFALASCQYSAGLLDRAPPFGTSRPGPAQASWSRLAKLLDDRPADRPVPSFIVLTGDQVYVDATAGLFDPRVIDDRYTAPYENLFAGRHTQDVLRRLPSFMLIDDHEIDDNWEPAPAGRARREGEALRESRNEERLRKGVKAYWAHQRGEQQPNVHAPLWTQRPIAGFDFFLADTRVDRQLREASNLNDVGIMGTKQFGELLDWMGTAPAEGAEGRPRFAVSPSMLLPRQLRSRHGRASALHSDAWDGYPASLHQLLAHVYEHRLGHVVFLSGDAHLSCIATATVRRSGDKRDDAVTLHSIHSSALYAPYPFANAARDDLAFAEHFDFSCKLNGAWHDYSCDVDTWFPEPGDGYAVLGLACANEEWTLDVQFDVAHGSDRKRSRQKVTLWPPHRVRPARS